MPSSAAFVRAVSISIVNEGGERFVTSAPTPGNPNVEDRGICSKFGITLATLSGYRGKACTAVDVKNLLLQEAQAIYEKMYWKPLRGDDFVCPYLAAAVFDAGVLTGTGNAAKMLQASVGAVVDGALGPKTLEATNKAQPADVLVAFSRLWQAYLLAIVQRDPTQKVFLVGWLRRAVIIQAYPYVF